MRPGIWQLVLIALIVALLFGTKRLRNIGEDVGAAIRSFRKGMADNEDPAQLNADRAEEPVQPEQAASSHAPGEHRE